MAGWLTRTFLHIEPKTAALVLGAVIATVGGLGAAQAAQGPLPAEGAAHPEGFLSLFYLDGEYNLPTLLSAGIMAVAAAAVYAAGAARERGRGATAWGALAAILLYFAVDDALKLHERVEGWTRVDWQLLFLPLIAAAGVTGLLVVARTPDVAGRLAFLAAGAAGVTAAVLEALQWDGYRARTGYRALMVPEEVLELSAGALAFIGALVVLHGTRRSR